MVPNMARELDLCTESVDWLSVFFGHCFDERKCLFLLPLSEGSPAGKEVSTVSGYSLFESG